jgi:hypothetical protein
MEKDQPKPFVPPEPAPEVEAREDVRAAASPVRCPYCHSDVSPDARDWVACRKCLARHHASCWRESGACASCRGNEPLIALVTVPQVAAPAPARPPRGLIVALLALVVSMALVVAIAVVAQKPVAKVVTPPPATAPVAPVQAPKALVPRFVVKPDAKVLGEMDTKAATAELARAVFARANAWAVATGQFKSSGQTRRVNVNVEPDVRNGHVTVSVDEVERWELEQLRLALVHKGDLEVALGSNTGDSLRELDQRGTGAKVRVEPKDVLTSSDIARVSAAIDHKLRPAVGVTLKPEANERFRAFRVESEGKPLAIIVDGEVLTLLTIHRYANGLVDTGVEIEGDGLDAAALIGALTPEGRYPFATVVEPAPTPEKK